MFPYIGKTIYYNILYYIKIKNMYCIHIYFIYSFIDIRSHFAHRLVVGPHWFNIITEPQNHTPLKWNCQFYLQNAPNTLSVRNCQTESKEYQKIPELVYFSKYLVYLLFYQMSFLVSYIIYAGIFTLFLSNWF